MPVTKLFSSGNLNAMKSEEGNDSLDTFIRQAIGKDPLLPFTRTGDSRVQWVQLLHALDQPDLPGWPLLTPLKVQNQKCEKCSREFCSPINYRRHIRVHRRSLNVNKESHKFRDLLAAFWDKLSSDEAKEVVSFDDVMLKEIPGSTIIRALASSLRKPGVWTLPQVYVKAGSSLLDIIQAKPSGLPISSKELFFILDDASESTFLCAGTAESVQKYVFDGEAAKNGLELKNLVASTSLLFEQQLVKAWVADKDVEALKCQKLLVEEEEAAQKRQAELLKRKKQKKLRQKEQKVKEQFYACNGVLNGSIDAGDKPGDFQTIESQHESENGHRPLAINCWKVPKFQKGDRYGFHVNQNFPALKREPIQKLGPSKDRDLSNGSKVWAKKFKMENNGERLKDSLKGETGHQVEKNNCEVIIGSISVTLEGCVAQQQDCWPNEVEDTCNPEPTRFKKNNAFEKPVKAETIQHGTDRGTSKLWRPVSCSKAKVILPGERASEDSEGVAVLEKLHDQILSSQVNIQSQSTDSGDLDNQKHHVPSDGNGQGNFPFSSIAAKEFLAQRWKEAISTDHVKLVLTLSPEPPGCADIQHHHSAASHTSNLQQHSVVGNASNHPGRSSQSKFKTKPDKSLKIKYIPKQKAVA